MHVLDVCRERLDAQFLSRPIRGGPADVVRALGAVQAQDYAGAKWALAQRTRAATDAEVERAVDAGEILRTHVLRPTWHFVAPGDIRWMLALSGPRVGAAMASYNRKLGLTPDVFRRSNRAIAAALADGGHLTRTELRAALERGGLKAGTGQRLAHLVMQAELDAVVCSGARRGNQFTYALLDARVPPAAPRDRDAALLALTLRYFATRGPATAQDFAWWSGLTVADVRRGIGMAGKQLRTVTIRERLHVRMAARRRSAAATPTAHLLPNYDEYFIGLRDRSAIAERSGSSRPVTGGSARIPHVLIVDGQLVGEWGRTLERDQVTVRLRIGVPLTPAEEQRVVAAAGRFGQFLGLPVELQRAARRQRR